MNHRDRFRERHVPPRSDVRTSLQPRLAHSATSLDELRRLVERARRDGVIVFLKSDLDALPDISRRLIETEHKRLCERR